jgi:hypothetical protein
VKSIAVTVEADTEEIGIASDARQEEWQEVCERFNDDVHRLKAVDSVPPYTALYACYDDDNNCHHYLVKEDRQLYRLRRHVFRAKLGRR